MGLSKQIFAYSVDTSAFYQNDERYFHDRLTRLYILRAKGRHKKWINRLIKEEKGSLSEILDAKRHGDLIRELNDRAIIDRNVISLFESSLTRALGICTNELTKDVFVVSVYFYQVFENLVKNGFDYDGEHYVFLTASAGQIRTKRSVFIREKAYDKIRMRLMCGLTWDDINNAGGINQNKFLAYLSLNNSATDVWEEFDIDKAIVVDDFETAVPGLVDYIDSVDFNITRKMTDTVIPHSDGWGMMDGHKTRMIRAPWIKGLLTDFPFNQWIAENCPNGKVDVYDIYGKKYTLPDDGIEYILTKSQFKLAKYYSSWNDYKNKFKQYGCEVCYCNIEEDDIPNARINYQMLQTLSDMTDVEIDRLTKRTIEEIKAIGGDFRTTMKLLGAHEKNRSPSNFQKALMLYPELLRDSYSQDVLKQTKKSYVRQARAGRLRVNGKYLFISPDPIAFCQWLFLGVQNPDGILADGEVYCRGQKDGVDLACLRSPHLYREWAIRRNKRNAEMDKWLSQTNCIYTSCHDLISRFLMFDVDGDKALVVKDDNLTRCAKRNMANIVPLAYDLRKAKGGMLSNDSLYDGMIAAYSGGNIGPISNNISKIWGNSDEVKDDELNAVKYLCLWNNATIDYAKTLWLPEYPDGVNNLIKRYTKHNLPNYFIYAKDKTKSQVEDLNDSTMNRISKKIPDTRLKLLKTLCAFDYTMLVDGDYGIDRNPESFLADRYTYWVRHQYLMAASEHNGEADEDTILCMNIRNALICETGLSADEIANTLVWLLYICHPTWTKKLLWGCFGDEIVKNIEDNLQYHGVICPVCGNRFIKKIHNQIACSDACARVLDNERRSNLRDFQNDYD